MNRKLDSNDKDITEAHNIRDVSTQNWTVAELNLSRARGGWSSGWKIIFSISLPTTATLSVHHCKKKKKKRKNTLSIQEVLEPSVGNGEIPLVPGQFCVHTGDEAGSERRRKSWQNKTEISIRWEDGENRGRGSIWSSSTNNRFPLGWLILADQAAWVGGWDGSPKRKKKRKDEGEEGKRGNNWCLPLQRLSQGLLLFV